MKSAAFVNEEEHADKWFETHKTNMQAPRYCFASPNINLLMGITEVWCSIVSPIQISCTILSHLKFWRLLLWTMVARDCANEEHLEAWNIASVLLQILYSVWRIQMIKEFIIFMTISIFYYSFQSQLNQQVCVWFGKHYHIYSKHYWISVWFKVISTISGFHCSVNEICTLLKYYPAYIGNFPTFRDNLSI